MPEEWEGYVKTGLTSCIFFIGIAMISVIDFIAIGVAFNDNHLNDCIGNENYFIDPIIFLKCGALTSVIFLFVAIWCKVGCGVDGLGQTIPRAFIVVYFVVWAIFGFIIYSKYSKECKQSNLGKMILGWSIFRIIEGCCGIIDCCYTIAVNIFERY